MKYKLKFRFKKEDDITMSRDNAINNLLSDIEDIISDTEIRKPLNGETIEISNDLYYVVDTIMCFEKEDDITYYTFVVIIESKKSRDKSVKDEKEKKYKKILKQLDW